MVQQASHLKLEEIKVCSVLILKYMHLSVIFLFSIATKESNEKYGHHDNFYIWELSLLNDL